jgi:hypothetical protein
MKHKNYWIRMFVCAMFALFFACNESEAGGEDVDDGGNGGGGTVITGFSIDSDQGVINNSAKTVVVDIPFGSALTGLSPVIKVSAGASVEPASGEEKDFSAPVIYTVTPSAGLPTIWTVTVKLRPLQTIAEVDTYLANVSGGSIAAAPVPLPVRLNLTDADEGLEDLLDKIQESGKYVELDLSACAMGADKGFGPGGTAISGEHKIVSLVLPDEADSVKAGADNSHFTGRFTGLKSLSGANVITIGAFGFSGCVSLASLDLPKATSIGEKAFYGCTALVTLDLPEATGPILS